MWGSILTQGLKQCTYLAWSWSNSIPLKLQSDSLSLSKELLLEQMGELAIKSENKAARLDEDQGEPVELKGPPIGASLV